MKYYLEVTKDKYQFPVHICSNVAELSEKSGASISTIYATISRYENGKLKKPRFVKVEVIEEKND